MPDFNEGQDDHTSIRDMLRDQTFELRAIRTEMQTQNKNVETLLRWKNGGDEPHTGVDVRLDRTERDVEELKERASTQNKTVWGALGAIGLLIVAKVFDYVHVGK